MPHPIGSVFSYVAVYVASVALSLPFALLLTLTGGFLFGPWVGGLDNFHIALGFSGHGLMQAPAVGRGLSELLLYGSYRTLDLSRMGYRRILDGMPLYDEVPKA